MWASSWLCLIFLFLFFCIPSTTTVTTEIQWHSDIDKRCKKDSSKVGWLKDGVRETGSRGTEKRWSGGVSYVTFSISGAQSPQQFTFPNYRYGPPHFILVHEWYDASVLQCTSRSSDDLMWQNAGVSYQSFASLENDRLYLWLVARWLSVALVPSQG